MAKHDIAALKRSISLPDLAGRYGVTLDGSKKEFKGLCPFHGENTPSFSVFDGKEGWQFYCFGCGARGDHLDFIQEYESVTTSEAINKLAEIVGGAPVNDNTPGQRHVERKPPPPPEWEFATAPKRDHPAPTELRIRRGAGWKPVPVVAAWPYHDADGALHGYACRVEPEPGKKDVIPVCSMTHRETGEQRWKQKSLPKPRLLYGARELALNPDAQVIITEGEKACDAARRLLDGTGIVAVSWPGGGKAVAHADWSALAGRKVVGWPDCDSKRHGQTGEIMPYQDQPGMAAMLAIAEHLPESTQFRIVAVPYPDKLADGWDLADAEHDGSTRDGVLNIIKRKLATVDEIKAMPAHEQAEEPPPAEPPDFDEPANDNTPPPDYDCPDEPPGDDAAHEQPFRILGYNRSTCYYMPDGFRQVVALRTDNHSKLRLLELAPLAWWRAYFPSEKRSGDNVDWILAAESLIRRAQRAGLWNQDMLRGRGAWWDDERAVVHVGDRVIVGGVPYELGEAPGRFVYELNERMDLADGDPLPNAEAVKLVEICEGLRWQRPISGKLLAGWVFLAPICGALEWRPHIWITGGAGSGKSTIMVHIVRRLLEGNMMFAVGETTEAGIRQTLRRDALPVVFDEIESQNEKATTRVNSIMDLMTISSSETGAKLFKGGANGNADSYQIRSMFCFSSITVNLKQHAAKTRVTVLDMRPKPLNETEEDLAQYNGMLQTIFETLTPEYISRLQARAVELIPVIRHNARMFAEAAALSVGSRRFGDQVGTLIAGAYALHSRQKVTAEAAKRWVEAQQWDEHDDAAESKDETACMQFILGQQVRVDSEKGPKTRTIGELVELAAGRGAADEAIPDKIAADTLRRHGMIVEEDPVEPNTLIIANNHPMLERMLSKSPWSTSWARTLARMPGAEKTGVKRFAGAPSRGVAIPLDSVL